MMFNAVYLPSLVQDPSVLNQASFAPLPQVNMRSLARTAPLLLVSPLWLIVQCLAQSDAPIAFNAASLIINKQQQDPAAPGREDGHKAKPASKVVHLRAGAPATAVFDVSR